MKVQSKQSRPVALREPRGLLLAFPAIVFLIGIFVFPIVTVVGVSLTDYTFGSHGAQYVGLENYQYVLTDDSALQALWHTLYYTLIVAPLTLALGLLIACMIQARLRPLHRKHLFEESAWLIRSDAATTVTAQAIRAPSERIHFYFGQGTAFQMY